MNTLSATLSASLSVAIASIALIANGLAIVTDTDGNRYTVKASLLASH
jgi:hypothetical protein